MESKRHTDDIAHGEPEPDLTEARERYLADIEESIGRRMVRFERQVNGAFFDARAEVSESIRGKMEELFRGKQQRFRNFMQANVIPEVRRSLKRKHRLEDETGQPFDRPLLRPERLAEMVEDFHAAYVPYAPVRDEQSFFPEPDQATASQEDDTHLPLTRRQKEERIQELALDLHIDIDDGFLQEERIPVPPKEHDLDRLIGILTERSRFARYSDN